MAIALTATVLAGCVSSDPAEPPAELVAAIQEGTKHSQALSECSNVYFDTEFVAALDSTSAEVRELAQPGPGGAARDIDDLPENGDTYIAICISELPEENPLDADLWALWMTSGSTAGGIVAAWNE